MFHFSELVGLSDFCVNKNIPLSCLFNANSEFINFQLFMSGIFTALGSVLSSGVNAASQAITNANNRDQAREAFDAQREEVRRQNEYNSPSMQVARMLQAGLSPSLAYGANGEVVGNQSDIPSFTPLPAESPQVGDFGEAFRQGIATDLGVREQLNRDNLAVAELAVKDSVSFMNVTSAGLNQAQQEEILTLLGFKVQDFENKFVLDEARFHEIMQNIAESQKRIELDDAQIAELDSIVSLNNIKGSEILALLPGHLRELDASVVMQYAQAGLLTKEVNRVAQEIETIQFRRSMDVKEYNFEVRKYNNDLKKWRAEQRISIEQAAAERRTSVLRVLLGGALIRQGSPVASPISGRGGKTVGPSHHGAGVTLPGRVRNTNAGGVPLGRGYRR